MYLCLDYSQDWICVNAAIAHAAVQLLETLHGSQY